MENGRRLTFFGSDSVCSDAGRRVVGSRWGWHRNKGFGEFNERLQKKFMKDTGGKLSISIVHLWYLVLFFSFVVLWSCFKEKSECAFSSLFYFHFNFFIIFANKSSGFFFFFQKLTSAKRIRMKIQKPIYIFMDKDFEYLKKVWRKKFNLYFWNLFQIFVIFVLYTNVSSRNFIWSIWIFFVEYINIWN